MVKAWQVAIGLLGAGGLALLLAKRAQAQAPVEQEKFWTPETIVSAPLDAYTTLEGTLEIIPPPPLWGATQSYRITKGKWAIPLLVPTGVVVQFPSGTYVTVDGFPRLLMSDPPQLVFEARNVQPYFIRLLR